MKDKELQGRVTAALAARLPDPIRREALTEAVRVLLDDTVSAQIQNESLSLLAPHLGSTELREVLAYVQKIDDRKEQIITAASMAADLPSDLKRVAVQQTMRIAQGIKDETERSESLVPLTARLAELGELDNALTVAWSLKPPKFCAHALLGIAPHLSKESLRKALERALEQWRRLREESQVPESLSVIAPLLDQHLISDAMAIARGLEGDSYRVTALTGLTPYVSQSMLRESVIPEEQTIKGAFGSSNRDRLRIAVAIRLAQLGCHEDAFSLVQSLEQDTNRVDAYEKIIPYLPEHSLGQVIAATEAISYEGARHSVLGALAPRFAQLGHVEVARSLIAEIKMGLQRALSAARTVPFVAEPLRSYAIEHVLIIITNMQGALGQNQHWWQGQALSILAPHLSRESLKVAWPLALTIEARGERREALAALAEEMAKLPRDVLYPLWTEAMHRLADRARESFLNDLQALAPIILALGGADATAEIIKTIQDVGRWW
jgi:hypothetical protein